MSDHKELATDYFERHQTSNECHITSDNRVFHTKGTAQGFAATLDDQEINSFTRTKVISIDSTNDDEQLTAKLNELENAELVKTNYEVLKDLVKYFKIEVADKKAETLIAALTDYKLKLKA